MLRAVPSEADRRDQSFPTFNASLMTIRRWITTLAAAVLLPASGLAASASAQSITTGAIGGIVTDSTGVPLGAAQVQVRNTATGYVVGGSTRDNGRYLVPNLEVGGPYSVTIRLIGFGAQTRDNVIVSLTQTTQVDFRLTAQAAQLSGVAIVATTSEFSSTRKGIETTVDDSTISRIPTLNRDFTDLVKLSPHVQSAATDGPSAAGAYNRLNNFTIDGANQNDKFGLGGSEGVPGGATNGRLISIDAVKEFQVLLTPADVRHGNFAGMIVNAVTKTGTNTFTGGATYAYRDPKLASNQDFIRNSDFKVHQYGFFLGGPIIKDRLHFFIAPEFQSRAQPAVGPYLGQATPEVGSIDQATYDRLVAATSSLFPIGGTGLVSNDNPLTNLSGRIDWSINSNHRLAIRQLINSAEQDEFSRNANSFNSQAGAQNSGFRFTSNSFIRKNTNNSSVAQLFSTFGNGASNEFQVGYNTVKDERIVPVTTPEISVQIPVRSATGTSNSGVATFGTEQFSPGNLLDQKILEISNNFTLPVGSHTFTLGGRFEHTTIFNNFAQRSGGVWSFNSLADLEARRPLTYSYGYSNGGPIAADFSVQQFALYAQDMWDVTDRLSVTAGVRIDMPRFGDSPAENPRIATAFSAAGFPEIKTSATPKSAVLFSPRIGVNWDPTGSRSTQIRATVGVFTGATPLILLGNAYANTGLGLVTLNCNNGNTATNDDVPVFTVDPNAQPTACLNQPVPAPGQATTAGVNLNDPNFKYPQNLSASAGFDQKLPWNTTFTFEALYRKAIQGLRIRDANLRGPRLVGGQPYRDRNGRVLYADSINLNGSVTINNTAGQQRVMTSLGEGAMLVTNQSEDYSYSISGGLRRRFGKLLNAGGSYTYMQSYDLQSLTSDRAISNWRNSTQYAGLETDLELTNSVFSRPHRISVWGTMTAPWKSTELSVYYNGNSGTPITYVVGNGDLNGDGYNGNDPIYIPTNATNASEISLGNLQNPNAAPSATNPFVPNAQMASDFENFIRENECLNDQRGQIMERNSCRTPWSQKVDVSVRQSLPEIRGQKLTVQLDIFNFGNLLNKKWGQIEQPILSPTFADQRVLTLRSRQPGQLSQSQSNFTFAPQIQQNGAFLKQQTLASNFYQMQVTLKYTF
jgi:outer membrane receptor protein involved in Fe transport